MNTIAIGRFLLDGPYVVGCRHQLADACLAAALRAQGLDARLYAGKPEGRVIDLARQFARMRTDACLWAVNPHTVALAAQVARQVALLKPGVQLFVQGDIDDAQWQALALPPTLALQRLPADPTAAAAALLAALGGSPGSIADSALLSPYMSGLLSLDDLPRLGLSTQQAPAAFDEELAWLAAQAAHAALAQPLPLAAPLPDAAALRALCARLQQHAAPLRFALQVPAALLGEALGAELQGGCITSLAALPDADQALAQPQGGAYGANGMAALQAGLYAEPQHTPGIRHLELAPALSPAQQRAALDWAAPHLESRCAVVLHAPPQTPLPLPALAPPLTPATGGWPLHSYLLQDVAADEEGAAALQPVHFDGRAEAGMQLRRVPLSQLATRGAAADGGTTVITLPTDGDVDALEQRLQRFGQSGQLCIEDALHDKLFENTCRWTERGSCQLSLLKRVSVLPDLRLRACRDAGDVGAVGDDFDALLTRIKREQQLQAMRRECAVCAVRDHCSQCSQLPQQWAGRYCGIRKAHPCASLYMELFSMGRALAQLFALPAAQALALQVSGAGLPQQHYAGAAGPAREGQRPVILSAQGRHLVWWRGSRRLARLSAPMALMAEAWWTSGSPAQIVAALEARFQVSSEVAASSLETGLDKLRAEGVIHA